MHSVLQSNRKQRKQHPASLSLPGSSLSFLFPRIRSPVSARHQVLTGRFPNIRHTYLVMSEDGSLATLNRRPINSKGEGDVNSME
jgi:hypothetical protein